MIALCKEIGASKDSYYAWRTREPSSFVGRVRMEAEAELARLVAELGTAQELTAAPQPAD
jgi:hypothetical protein